MSDADYAEAAAELGMSEWWLKKHIKRLPHQKYGTVVRFTPSQIQQIRDMHSKNTDGGSPAPAADELRPSARRRRRTA